MKKDNKGIALITVVIATTFIGILAASLLYMSYMNYITKNMRYNSNDAFYSAEYVLDELTTLLQQEVSNYCETNPDATIAEAIDYVAGLHGSTSSYDPGSFYSLLVSHGQSVNSPDYTVQLSSVDATAAYENCNCGRASSCHAGGAHVEGDGKNTYLTFHNLKITVTEQNAFKYTSSIVTHITLRFSTDGDGDMDVNDFSILADRPLKFDGGNLVYSGNIFIKADQPDQDALTLTNNTVMTLNGEHGIIYGNVNIGSNCALSINGNVRIVGKVIVNGGGTLVINDPDCGCSGGTVNNGRIIINGSIVSEVPGKSYDSSRLGDGVMGQLYADHFEIITYGQNQRAVGGSSFYNCTYDDTDDLYTQHIGPGTLKRTAVGALLSSNFNAWYSGSSAPSELDWKFSDSSVGWNNEGKGSFNTQTEVLNNGARDALITLGYPSSSGATKGSYVNCTILSPFCSVSLGGDDTQGTQGHGAPSYSKMKKSTYDDALTVMFGTSSGCNIKMYQTWTGRVEAVNVRNKLKDAWGNDLYIDGVLQYEELSGTSDFSMPPGFAQINFGGSATEYKAMYDCIANQGTDAFKAAYPNVQYTFWSEPSDKTVDPWGHPVTGGYETRYVFCDGSKTYFPYGFFLRGNTKTILSGIFNSVDSGGDPSDTSSYYSYWLKE